MIFPKEFIETVKRSNDIVDVVSEFIDLERSGDIYKGRCPNYTAHAGGDDSDPSLVIYPGDQTFYCFACNAGGKRSGVTQSSDVIGFVRWVKGFNFNNSIEWLARRKNIPIPESGNDKRYYEMQRLYKTVEAQTEIYHKSIWTKENLLQYLYDRGLSDDDIKDWKLGVVPDDTQFLSLKGKLVFPIWDELGRPVALSFRSMDGSKPKYRNSPESPIWKKGSILYALHKAKEGMIRNRHAIITEGFMDVIMLHKYGVTNSVGTMGTSLTDEHIEMLKKHVDDVTIFIDGDSSGEDAASRYIKSLRDHGLNVSVVPLYNGQDPADKVKQIGDKINEFIENNLVNWVQFEVSKVMNRYYTQWNSLRLNTIKLLDPIMEELTEDERGMYGNILRDLLEVRPWYEQHKDNLARGIAELGGRSEGVTAG